MTIIYDDNNVHVVTFPLVEMPLNIHRYTTSQAANNETTIHQLHCPPIATSGDMFNVSRYQKYVVGELNYNVKSFNRNENIFKMVLVPILIITNEHVG